MSDEQGDRKPNWSRGRFMHDWSREILKRLVGLNLPPAREAEIVEEVAQHLEDRYQELVAGGVTEEVAHRVALEALSDGDLLAGSLRRAETQLTQEHIMPGGGGGVISQLTWLTRQAHVQFS
jgi:putative ABC transport system permease protein